MKKRTHTHTYFEISSSRVHDFTLVVEAFFGPWTKIGPLTFFFSFPFFSSSSQNTPLSLSLSLFFIIASQKEARTQPRARKRREFTTRSAFFIARVLLVLYMPRYRMYFFLSQKQDKRTKAKRQKRKKEGGG